MRFVEAKSKKDSPNLQREKRMITGGVPIHQLEITTSLNNHNLDRIKKLEMKKTTIWTHFKF
jgi:hypothetical protein